MMAWRKTGMASLVVVTSLLSPRMVRAEEPEEGLRHWLDEAAKRGEPVSWADIVGNIPPPEENGCYVAAKAGVAGARQLWNHASTPSSRWSARESAMAGALVAQMGDYFEALETAGKLTGFRPLLVDEPAGGAVPLHAEGLTVLCRALTIKSQVNGGDARSSVEWLLRALRKWRPRTWFEGYYWDRTAITGLTILERIALDPDFPSRSDLWNSSVDRGLLDLEGGLINSIPYRIYSRRHALIYDTRETIAGRDLFSEMARIAKLVNAARCLLPPGIAIPEIPVPSRGVGKTSVDVDRRRALVDRLLSELAVYSVALNAAGSVASLRAAVEAPLSNVLGRAASPAYGGFEQHLRLLGRVRTSRISLAIMRVRSLGSLSQSSLDRILANDDYWDPLSGLPFVGTLSDSQVVISRRRLRERALGTDTDVVMQIGISGGDARR